jgi:hypothetical protein
MVKAMNEFGPATIGMFAFEWIYLTKTDLLEKLEDPGKVKARLDSLIVKLD